MRGSKGEEALHDAEPPLWGRCKTRASIPLDATRRPRNTPIWKLEPALKCRSRRTPHYSPPVHMVKLTRECEITPYVWTHPDGDDRG
jgi:hypothetical protein